MLARRPDQRLSLAHIVFAAVMALTANVVLLRDVLATRLPDVIALAVVPTPIRRWAPLVDIWLLHGPA